MRQANVLIAVFLIALVLRAGVAIWLPKAVVWPDGHRYERVALNLIEREGFGDLGANAMSVPTQPLLIAAVYIAVNILAVLIVVLLVPRLRTTQQ